MSDSLGPIVVPDPPTISAFPFQPDYGGGIDYTPPIAIHSFDQPGLKTEQRYLLGSGARRFRIVKDHLSCDEYDNLKAHFEQAQGSYAQFPYTHPTPAGNITVTARYENPNIAIPHLLGVITSDPGVTLLEVPTVVPAYTSVATVTRLPDATLTAALLDQVQRMIPLITITPRDGTAPMHISNQRCTVNGQLYLPRLVNWGGISQTIGEASDSATFTMGNADDVWTKLANQVNLLRAGIQFSLYHVNTNYIIQLWGGYARPWSMDSTGQFVLPASDGIFELGLAYPVRQLSRTCWKVYRGRFCPASASNGFPDCPKDYDSCVARGVPKSFGGVVALPQSVSIKDNSTGVFGFGRSRFTSVSIADDSVYDRPVQETYTDEPMLVTCDVAVGRDESEFYSALGIVGEGPIGGYNPNLLRHTLDGQPPHDPLRNGGFRGILGNDPAGDSDYFILDQSPWVKTIKGWVATVNNLPTSGNQDGDGWITQDTVILWVWNGDYFANNGKLTFAAGLAFAEIRRTDAVGLQLSAVTDRSMSVTVDQGIAGWIWTAPGARVYTGDNVDPTKRGLSNPVWVAVNVYLRAIGLRVISSNAAAVPASEMEKYFDVNQAIAAAAICDLQVPSMIVPTNMERQFPFRGVLKEKKPLKDWLTEILNCCLGYYTFVNGKLWVGIRYHSGAPSAYQFNRNSILYQSLMAAPLNPQFNWLLGQFGDEEFNWALNTVGVYDMDAASLAGNGDSPQYTQSTMTFVGVSNKSQCARIVTTRLREEIGGVGPDEQRNARNFSFRTTLMALQIMAGDIVAMNHVRLPNGYCEGRVQNWILNPDFSIDIQCTATTDSMYALDSGPKPQDGPAAPPLPEHLPSINGLTWMPNEVGPVAADPIYPDMLERTFDLWQDYKVARDGSWEAALWVAGEMCINQFVPGLQPRILTAVLAAGGTLNGPQTVYLAITQRLNSMLPLAPSNLAGVYIPAGATGRKITLNVAASPDSDPPWDLWAGNDRRAIGLQSSGTNVQPSVDFLGPIHPMTEGLPEAAARKVAIAAKKVWHSGVAGVTVTGVTAPNKIQCNDFEGSTDDWVDSMMTALADQSDGSAPLWNFVVTAFDSATGTFTVEPDCVRAKPEDSVQEGDVLIMRSWAVTADATSVTDPLWNNSVARNQFGSAGLRPDEEKGRICRILRGVGAGQYRFITGNTATKITVNPPWDVIPNLDSMVIVEAADWIYQAETSDLQVPIEGARVEIRMRVENLVNQVALVAGFLVDDQGRYSDESVAPMREIFVYGQPPGVRAVGPDATAPWLTLPTDQTIRVDTSGTGDVTVLLLPLADYNGRTLYFSNDNGPNNAIVQCADGEALFDGNTFVTLAPLETVRVTSG